MGKARKTAVLKAYARLKTPFTRVDITEKMITEHPLLMHCYAIYGNSRIEVQMFKIDTAIGGVMQTTFIRHGDIAPLTWEEIQDALHELFNPETVAVEVYPALADQWQAKTNIRVLWVLPSTWPLPFGLQMASAWGKPA